MIIEYQMRGITPHGRPTEWVEFCGEFADWDTFDRFKERERERAFREIRNAKEVQPSK